MEPVTAAAGKGIEHLFDYGAAMTVLILVLIAGGFLVKYLLARCDARFSDSLETHKELTLRVTDVVEKNAAATTLQASAITQLSENIRNMKG